MNYLKRVVATVAVLVLIFSLAACSTAAVQTTALPTVAATATPVATTTIPEAASAAPSPTEAVATPSPEPGDTAQADDDLDEFGDPIPDITKVGITSEQYKNIEMLLDSALNMYVDFKNVKSLKVSNMLDFVDGYLYYNPDLSKDDQNVGLSAPDIEKIINSAFAVDYHAKKGDTNCGSVVFKNGKFIRNSELGEDGIMSSTYSITRIASNRLQLKINIIGFGDDCNDYEGKAVAVIQEDKNSLFGYHLVSLESEKETHPKFTTATASSCLPNKGSKTFGPENVLDKKNNTASATGNGTGEWILLSSDKAQAVTGISFKTGDWTSGESSETSGQPSDVRLDFSDGTFIEGSCMPGNDSTGVEECLTFDRIVETKYIKITIQDIDPDRPAKGIYISEISPF